MVFRVTVSVTAKEIMSCERKFVCDAKNKQIKLNSHTPKQ